MSGLKLKNDDGIIKKSPLDMETDDNVVLDEDWLTGSKPFVVKPENIPKEDMDAAFIQIEEGVQQFKEAAPEFLGDMVEKLVDEVVLVNVAEPNRQEMEAATLEFSRVYGEYFRNQKSDDELLEYTTQPFWQSMRLSKNRLREKGLMLEVDMIPEGKNSNNEILRERFKANKRPMSYKMSVKEDGQNEYGTCTQNVLIRRRFLKDGRRIFKKVETEQHVATCLKSKVNGDQACCPNCGFVGSIASFIDGCDACGSRFTVKDFEPKVSGFSFEQNPYIQFKNLATSSNEMIGIIFFAFFLTMMAFVCIAPVFAGSPVVGKIGNYIFPAFVSLFISVIMMVLLRIIAMILRSVYANNIRGKDVANRTMHNMSLNDFYQNLEYKIRNIHLSDKAKEVQVFSKCDLSNTLPMYKDVIDCDMTYLKLLSGNRSQNSYHFDCMARVRMTKCTGKRIHYAYEDVYFGVRGKQGVVDREATTMRMYRCENCGSTLNLLEGAVCKYCGNEYDLENYDWVIDSYSTKKKNHMVPIFVKLGMIVVFLATVIISIQKVDLGRDSTIIINDEVIYDPAEDGSSN